MPVVGLQSSYQNISSYGTVNYSPFLGKGVNYLSLYHMYSSKYTTDDILRRDFSRFQQDGINVISLSLYWYRLEGNTRGDYDGEYKPYPEEIGGPYGKRFLDDIKRVIQIAHEYEIKVLIAFNTLWGENDSPWCTPDYVIDPVTGKNIGLAVVRSQDMKQAFIDMVNRTVRYLAGTPGIWAWAILNEPWYWGRAPNEHDFITNNGKTQKENFIDLIQELASIAKTYDGRPVTVKFCSTSQWTGTNGVQHLKNIFVDDWGWNQKIFDTLDFISFNDYISQFPELTDMWQNITATNVNGSNLFDKKVWITEFGFDSSDENTQALFFNKSIQFYETLPVDLISAWYWESDNNTPGTFGFGGSDMNICADAETGNPRTSYNELIKFDPKPQL